MSDRISPLKGESAIDEADSHSQQPPARTTWQAATSCSTRLRALARRASLGGRRRGRVATVVSNATVGVHGPPQSPPQTRRLYVLKHDCILPSPEPPQQIQQEDMHGQIEVPSLRSRKKEVYANIAQVCERWDLVEMSRQASSSSTASTSAPPPSDRPARGASIISIPMSSSTALPPSRSRSPTKHPGSSALHHHDSISEYGGSNIGSNASGSGSLVPNLIEVTTAAIRSAQRYFLSLPPEKLPFTSNQISSQQQKPTASLGLITAARPIPRHTLVSSLPSTSSRQPSNPATRLPAAGVPFPSQNDDEDPLLKLRKVSLDTLGALKEMERRLRLREPSSSSSAAVAHRTPSSEQAALVASLSSTSIASGSGSGIGQPSLVFSEDLSSASDVSSSLGAHDVDHSATGHLYREDVNLADLQAEARVVRSWIETVDGLLSYKSIASPSRERRSSSPGSDRCPAWARKAIEVATPLGTCFLAFHQSL